MFSRLLSGAYAKDFWYWWRSWKCEMASRRSVLELKRRPDVEKHIKAMESVFAGWWQIHDPPNVREKWLDGEYQLGFSIEMVSTEGKVHFYIRLPEESRRIIESALYAQFPDAELLEVEDFLKAVPENIPNRDWRMWGSTLKLEKEVVFPLPTFPRFFEHEQESLHQISV